MVSRHSYCLDWRKFYSLVRTAVEQGSAASRGKRPDQTENSLDHENACSFN
jgi:hypothetical protein